MIGSAFVITHTHGKSYHRRVRSEGFISSISDVILSNIHGGVIIEGDAVFYKYGNQKKLRAERHKVYLGINIPGSYRMSFFNDYGKRSACVCVSNTFIGIDEPRIKLIAWLKAMVGRLSEYKKAESILSNVKNGTIRSLLNICIEHDGKVGKNAFDEMVMNATRDDLASLIGGVKRLADLRSMYLARKAVALDHVPTLSGSDENRNILTYLFSLHRILPIIDDPRRSRRFKLYVRSLKSLLNH